MIKIFNANKELKLISKKQLDFVIEHELDNADETLSFFVPVSSKEAEVIEQEGYIQTKDQEYVIKEVNKNNNSFNVVAKLNLEDFEGKPHKSFESRTATIEGAINLAIVGTGWTVAYSNITKKRTVRKVKIDTLELIQHIKKIYNAELIFNALEKKIYIYDHIGSYKGAYIRENINLTQLSGQSNSYDFYTRVEAEGAEGLTFADINNGKSYVEDYSYSNKVKTYFWKDERYTNPESLLEDARIKLEEMARPRFSYSVEMINLIKEGKEQQDYGMGDTIELVSKSMKVKELQRIVKLVEYPNDPERNYVELSNTLYSLEDINNKFEEAVETIDNITNQDGTIDGSLVDSIETSQIKDLDQRVNSITADKATVGQINAIHAIIGELEATKASIAQLEALKITVGEIDAGKANITDLSAINAIIGILQANVGRVETLLSGNITAENIQTGGITSDKLTIANGFITNAMIASLDVAKINAGDISTNKFRIVSDNGNMLISDNTIQIRDKNRVRVQIGKDASNDYNMYVWDSAGKLMFDATGLKADGIKNKIIRDDMISDTANISGSKVNISSLITEINKDTNTSVIKSSKVQLDTVGQSLEVAFNSLKSNVDNIQVGGRNLILNSKTILLNGSDNGNKNCSIIENDYVKISPINNGNVYNTEVSTCISRIQGKTYTLTFEILTPTPIGFYWYPSESYQKFNYINASSKWQRISFTYTQTAIDKNTKTLFGLNGLVGGNIYYYRNLKLEEGNKPTGWTPAIEDIDTKIESNTTAITVAQGKIDALISENTIIKGDITTISNKYTSLKATVDGISTTVASHTSSIGTINTNINGLSGKVTTVENKYTSLSQDLTGFKTTVSNNYSTKSELSTVDGKVIGLTSRVNTAESSITQLNNKIDLKVEATDVTEAINNIKIGTKNLLLGTKDWKYGQGVGTITTETYHGCKVLHKDNSTGTSYVDIATWSNVIVVKPNTEYTLSFYAKGKGSFTSFFHPSSVASGYSSEGVKTSSIDGNTQHTLTSEWKRYWITWKTLSNASGSKSIIAMRLWSGSIGYICGVKFEEGNKATDFTVATEDVDSSIANVQTQVTTTSNKVATIETNLSSITQRVSSTESTVSTHTSQLSTVDSRINTAKNSAISTAANDATSKANTAQTNAINSAKGYTDGQITTVNQTITNKVAEIKATTDSITSTVSKVEQIATSSLQGKMLFTDPTFKSGTNSIVTYNNSNNGNVVVSRVAKSSDCPTTSSHMIQITTNGTASPGHGGFYWGNMARANAIFITKIIAKIPTGCALNWASNATGNDRKSEWLTDNIGTGNWKEYIFKVTCGSSGSFASTNYFYLSGGSAPVTWYLAFATVFDITDTSNIESRMESAEQKITPNAILSSVNTQIGNGGQINTVSTVLDKTGFTVKNGAIKVQNKAGTTVLSGDSNGNLVFTGTAKSQSGAQWVGLDSGGITFQDSQKNEQMLRAGLSYFSSNRDMNGVNFALARDGDFVRFSHVAKTDLTNGWSPSDTQYNFFDCWSSDQTVGGVSYKKGINVYSPMFVNNGIQLFSGTNYPSEILGAVSWDNGNGAIWNMMGLYGDNGTILGYKSGSSLMARFLVSEDTHPGTGDNIKSWGNYNFNGYTFHNASIAANYLTVSGSKNCLQKTKNYGERLINAYETAEYYFGDLGFGEINEAGECLVYIEDIFLECVNTNAQYHVFTQIYNGLIKTIERYKTYFIVKGEPGTSFSWELKAKRIGYENNRLDTQEIENQDGNKIELFGYEDFKVETSEDTLMNVLTFELEDLLLMEG